MDPILPGRTFETSECNHCKPTDFSFKNVFIIKYLKRIKIIEMNANSYEYHDTHHLAVSSIATFVLGFGFV